VSEGTTEGETYNSILNWRTAKLSLTWRQPLRITSGWRRQTKAI